LLRKQAKDLQNKVKTRGFILTLSEQEIIQNAKLLIFQQSKTVIFRSAFIEYILLSGRNFPDSFGSKQQLLHYSVASDVYLYHSYK